MKGAILNDYRRAVPTLDCFARLAGDAVAVLARGASPLLIRLRR